ncbi:MAG: class I SAM-dependent methyltransferase [Anaerolineales bacterium]|nr:class I SAM-dependent methyltransferase [Anaerolineales bacterium]
MQVDPDELEIAALRGLSGLAGRRVLEVGAGDGRLSELLAAEAAQWVALDTDRDELTATDGVSQRRLHADARRLPFPDAVFEVVFFSYALC